MDGFRAPKDLLGHLDAEAAAALVAAMADVAVVVNGNGVVRDMTCQSEELSSALQGDNRWLGQPFVDTVTVESRPKLEALLREASENQASPRRQVNHPTVRGADVPILYSAIWVGSLGRLVAVGRDLRPIAELQQRLIELQQSMERDYAQLRHAETRYRLLFQLSPEPMLVLDSTQRIAEANPASARLFGERTRIVGRPIAEFFAPDSVAAVQAMLAGVRAAGRAEGVQARLAAGEREVLVFASMLRQEGGSLFLFRLSAVNGHAAHPPDSTESSPLLRFFDSAPDGLVLTDREGRVRKVNHAFLELAQLASEEQARGQSLERWLGRTGVDLSVMNSSLRQGRSVRLFATRLQGELGGATEVEISAIPVPNEDPMLFGFAIRDVGRRLKTDLRTGGELPRSVEQLAELVGRVSLRELVREATDVIERLCIEAALELTDDNRASAAEMLGLSRQSLYVKLRRYGLIDPSEQGDSDIPDNG